MGQSTSGGHIPRRGSRGKIGQPARPVRRPTSASPVSRTKPSTAIQAADRSGWADWTRSAARSSPALLFSILFHVVLLLALGIATIATVQRPQELVLTATSSPAEPAPEVLDTMEIDPTDELELTEPDLEAELPQFSELAVADVELPALSDSSSATAATNSKRSAGNERGGGKGSRSTSRPGAAADAVHFCGTAAVGNRFAFVVDNSNSMVNGKMLATMDQLLRAVDAMRPKQAFFVVMYSDTAYPMFYPDAATDFAPASKANKRRLREWLKTIEINAGGDLETAMQLVFELKPDAVFILGDGTGYGETEREMLIGFNPQRQCAINTIALGAGRQGTENLREIARVNGGQFQALQTHPVFVEMAKSVKFRKNPRGSSWSQRVGKKR